MWTTNIEKHSKENCYLRILNFQNFEKSRDLTKNCDFPKNLQILGKFFKSRNCIWKTRISPLHMEKINQKSLIGSELERVKQKKI